LWAERKLFLTYKAAVSHSHTGRGGFVKYFDSKRIFQAILVSAVMLTASAWAADTPAAKGSMDLQQPTNVAGTQLASGKYRVEWTGTGDQVDVKVFRGTKEVVSTRARMVKVDAVPYDHVSFTTGDKGARSLTEISFSKQNFALRLDNASAPQAEQAAK
jgi:hypothetical protein